MPTLSKTPIVLSLAAAAALIPAAAQAGDVYVYGSVGQTDLGHEVERNIGANPPVLPVQDASGSSSTSTNDASFQIAAGYEFDLAQLPVSIGVEGFYGFEDAGTRNINGVLVTDVDLDSRYGARVLFNYDVTDQFGFYTHGGLSVVDYDVTQSYTFAPPVTNRSDSETAFAYGLGMRYELRDNLSLVVDYTRVDEIAFDGIPEVAGGTGRVNPNTLDISRFSTGLRLTL